MKKRLFKLSKEIKTISISVLLLTLIFAFNDKRPEFIFSAWFSNFFKTLFLVMAVVLCNLLGLRMAGGIFNEKIFPKIFGSHRFATLKKKTNIAGFREKPRSILPVIFLTPIFPLLVMLISNGHIIIAAIHTFSTKVTKKVGKEFMHLEERQLSFIAMASIMFNLILLVIFKGAGIPAGVKISSWFIFWNLLPIQDLIGSKMFFGTKILYTFFFIFTIFFILLINLLSLWALIPALILASILTFWYFFKFELPR
ncbi:MAG: hypothetical protein KKG60_03105 [Nanoarchaeota archaeon]|nr:hypothetical protein [Nanoarchaeota archaeon]